MFSVTTANATENEKDFVFIGKKISLISVQPEDGKISLDSRFLAKYHIIEPFRGTFNGNEIEFTVFDHYGTPPFSNYNYVLLYVVLHDGEYYHSKYQYSPLYKTKSGKWAGAYAAYDYNHSFNKDTKIRPEKIYFSEQVIIDISRYKQENIDKWFPEPFYKINGDKAIAVYGNYVEDLFLLKQNGVLKARGEFQ